MITATRTVGAATCVGVLCTLAGLSAAEELWRQDPIDQTGGRSSQDARNPGGLGWFSEVVDNFDATEGWTISSVSFWGGYVSTTPGNTTGFTVRFYANNNGAVGQLLSAQDVSTFTEVPFFISGTGAIGYRYEVTLPQAFSPPSAGSYWVSVVAILPRGNGVEEPQWGWIQATTATATAPSGMQWFFSPGNFTPFGHDVAFVLNGTDGPTCGSADYNGDGDVGTDADIEAFFACLAGTCCATCGSADFDANGDVGTDADIEAFFRVLAGGAC
jgi:hypothetical protein